MGLDIGAEGGVAIRSHSTWGPFVGGHLELRPITGLRVGVYVTDTVVTQDGKRTQDQSTSHVSIGGRLRYFVEVAPKLKLFGTAGLGYVQSQFPSVPVAPQGIVNPTLTQSELGQFDIRDGHFLELPIGGGVAYTVFEHTNLSLNLAWRPGFSFQGSAYEGEGAYAKPTQGFSASLGLSFYY